MSDIEKSQYIDLLKEMLADQKRQIDRLTNDNRRLSDLQKSGNAQLAKANDSINKSWICSDKSRWRTKAKTIS